MCRAHHLTFLLADVVADQLGLLSHTENHAHLYHNLGSRGFYEVSREVGL